MLAGLFHPTTAYEISLQGLSPAVSRRDSSPRRALVSLVDARLCSCCPEHPSSHHPAFRALIRLPVRFSIDSAINAAEARSPLEFSPPRVFLRPPCRRLHVRSAHGLFGGASSDPDAGLQRINRCATFVSISRNSPRSRFVTCIHRHPKVTLSREARLSRRSKDRRA